jgi:RNA polymerase sigma-70 factor (ECF subfamily)
MTESTDAELIQAVLDGSSPAFERLMDRYEERVFRLLSRYSRDHAEVEDLAQEVFVKVFRKLHTFQQDASLYTWIYRIAVNTANDHFSRHSRRQLRLVGDEEILENRSDHDVEGTVTPLLDAERREVTRQIVNSLPEKYRTILVLREFEDLSYTDMAEVLGISIGTVESRLFRARQRFKEALERRFPELVPGASDGLEGGRR